MAEAVRDRRVPVDDKIHTWPHLVRMEFLVALFVMVALTLWAMMVDAPLEEPANPTRTPNPSKAPWYFLGLQEMLVYFDPWHAGVVLPTLIIVGLMIIPYIDINPKGNGYYCFRDRKYEILTFFFRLPRVVDRHHHHRHVFSRTGVELVLALATLGCAQSCCPDQCGPAVSFRPSQLLVVGDFWFDGHCRLFRFRLGCLLLLGSQSERKRVSRALGHGAVYSHRGDIRPDAFTSCQNVFAVGIQRKIHSSYTVD
jgi:hypothetical protein